MFFEMKKENVKYVLFYRICFDTFLQLNYIKTFQSYIYEPSNCTLKLELQCHVCESYNIITH